MKKILSLRGRLFLALLPPIVAILSLSSIFDYRLAQQTANQAHDQALLDTLYDLEDHFREKNGLVTSKLAAESEAMLRSSTPDMIYFSVYDEQGRYITGDTDLLRFDAGRGDQVAFFDGRFRERPVRIAAHRFSFAGHTYAVQVAETTLKREEAKGRILTAMILPNLAVVVATMIAVFLGVRRGLLPLREVEEDIGGRSANDLHEIDLQDVPLEVRPMLSRLNELFRLLRESARIQQRFIADAAHQLRTPLAGLQTQLDLACVEGAFAGNSQRQQLIEESTTRIGHLLAQLLAYARMENAPALRERFESVALEQLLEKAASNFLDAALAKDIDLGFETAPTQVAGIPWMLQEALSNLIDNALRYTPQGGVVTVRCGQEAGASFLAVDDSGPGISAAHRHEVFERFYRIPGTPGNGCGLGLAIVAEIAELHGARIQLDEREGGGLCVKIVFPPPVLG